MKVLDLFSGIGGFSLGLGRAGMQTVGFCEIEDYPSAIIKKHWPDVPNYRDVRKLDGTKLKGTVDLICGGFPCQPFSVAGKQKGKEDDRHLWPDMLRLIREIEPSWVIGENVAGFIKMALDDVLLDLENEGYTAQSFVIPACAVGADHRRDRVWIVAHTNRLRIQGHSIKQVLGGGALQKSSYRSIKGWAKRSDIPKPRVIRGTDGVPSRVDRTKALGNAVVPQIPEIIGRAIIKTIKSGK